MCTLVLWRNDSPLAPLVLAANRDERPGRPTRPVHVWRDEHPGIVAGQDLEAGGTWLGVSALGLVIGLTNLRSRDFQPTRPSRGLLVTELLRQSSADAAVERLEQLARRRHNPFSVIIADHENAYLADVEDRPELHRLHTGVHVVTNLPLHRADRRRRRSAQLADAARTGSGRQCRAAARRLLVDHLDEGDGPICVHRPTWETVSSSLIELHPERLRWEEVVGHPCTDSRRVRRFSLRNGGFSSAAAVRPVPRGRGPSS